MKLIRNILTCFLLFSLTSYAYTQEYKYDPLLMRAQASIFPKIILLDNDLDKKTDNDQVVISIVHSSHEKNIALQLKEIIQKQYKSRLGKLKLAIELIEFEHFDETNIATAYILLKGTEQQLNKVATHAAKRQRLSFGYDYKDFESNLLVSVQLKEKIYIYLNKTAIHDYDIKFMPLFYKIVKVIE